MKHLLVLGAGTAGTMVVNKLRRRLNPAEWRITIVDQDNDHLYQPGLLFVPFGEYRPEDLVKPRERFIPDGVDLVMGEIDQVEAPTHTVLLTDGRRLRYDYLVIATGTSPRPDQTPGMIGPQWRKSIFDFYTLEGATALRDALRAFTGGRLVVNIVDMPIKCPVAPLEFTFLAESHLRARGLREKTEIVFVTPLSGAFTKPIASAQLGSMLDDRRIGVEADFMLERVDPEAKTLVSYDDREVPFDLLVTIPMHLGADFIARSGLGNDLNYVPVDKHTLLSRADDTIFAVGDANDIPTSKAGSVAHFSIEVFTENFLQHVAGQQMTGRFDGHANCFIESGDGKGLLIDFNYDTEPLTGTYPLPTVGPFDLLRESRRNHWGKLAFRPMYWHLLLPADPSPCQLTCQWLASTSPARRTDMPVATIDNQNIHVDDEGFLTEYDEWSDHLATVLAATIGIELTDEHWKAIRFLREDYPARGETATIRQVSTLADIPVKQLFALFPGKPAKKMAYIAGLPKPHGCV